MLQLFRDSDIEYNYITYQHRVDWSAQLSTVLSWNAFTFVTDVSRVTRDNVHVNYPGPHESIFFTLLFCISSTKFHPAPTTPGRVMTSYLFQDGGHGIAVPLPVHFW